MTHSASTRRLWLMAALLLLPCSTWAQDDRPVVTVTTTDGKQLAGTILDGTLTLQSTFGAKTIAAQQIRLFSPAGLTLTSGLMFTGTITILDGQMQMQTDKGVVTIAGPKLYSVHGQSGYLATAPPAGPSPDSLSDGETKALVLGKWQDSNGVTWEFLQDGTVTQGNSALHYSFPDHRHLKLHVGQAGAGMAVGGTMGGAVMPMLGGLSLDRVYEIASLSRQKMVFKYQGNELSFTRRP
jgi:hypothetical protein